MDDKDRKPGASKLDLKVKDTDKIKRSGSKTEAELIKSKTKVVDEDEFQPSLWKAPSSTFSIPKISVNELAVELHGLEPRVSTTANSTALSTTTAEATDGGGSSSSDEAQNVHAKIFKDHQREEGDSSGIHQHLKQWRRKLLILIWLNFTMRYRRAFNTMIEVIVPILILCVSVYGFINNGRIPSITDSLPNNQALTDSDAFSPFNIMSRQVILETFCADNHICNSSTRAQDRHYLLVYAPETAFTTKLVKSALEVLKLRDIPGSKLVGVNTAQQVEDHCKKLFEQAQRNKDTVRFPTGIIFSFNDLEKDPLLVPDNTPIPRRLNYVIRTYFPEIANTVENFPLVERLPVVLQRQHVNPYIFTGVAGLQTALDEAYIGMIVDHFHSQGKQYVPKSSTSIANLFKEFSTQVHVQQFKYPFFLDEDIRNRSWAVLVIIFILTNAPSNFCFVQDFCYQAEQGRTELLKFHGLTPILSFLSHGIITCIFRAMSSLGLTAVLYYGFMKTSALIFPSLFEVWLFLFSHSIAEQAGSLFLSHFFSNPSVGGMMTLVRSLVTFLVPMHLYLNGKLSRVPNVIIALFFTQWNFANGLYSFLQYQLYDEGLMWFDFPVIIDTSTYVIIPLQTCCMIFVYTGTAYMMLAVYMDIVFPRTNSPGRGLLFFLKKKNPEYGSPPPIVEYDHHRGFFENIPPDTPCTIKIRDLSKVVDDTERQLNFAVDNFSLDIHEGEITAIVGKAGSGKTRLLNMICGVEKPTKGYVEIRNLNVAEYGDVVTQYMSLVPQTDMLFDTLSVDDHVKLSCMLHGISYRKSKMQTKQLLQLFDLVSVRRHLHTNLSFTQQKRLGIAMALASHPNIIILDDPTHGLDVEASKQLWRALQLLKVRRTIVISTSSMDEVELYCDRMALMAQGKLIAYASPSRIKRALDIGFVLNLREENQRLNEEDVEKTIRTEVKDVVRLNPVGYEPLRSTHRYLMPHGAHLAALLEKLEDNIDKLRFSKCFVGRVDLDSLFYKMSIKKGTESVVAERESKIVKEMPQGSFGLKIETIPDIQVIETAPNQWRNFKTLLFRKIRHTVQKNKLVVTDFLVPVILFALVFGFSEIYLKVRPESAAQPLSINMYEKTLTYIRPTSNTQQDQDLWYETLEETLSSPVERISIGTSMREVFDKTTSHSSTNYEKQSIVAFEKSSDHFIGYYSAHALHGAPIALNVIANSFLRVLAGDKYQIRVANYPLREHRGASIGSVYNNATTVFGCLISLIVCLVSATELNLPMTEIKNNVKRLIIMCGCKPSVYWLANWSGDIVVNAFIAFVLVGLAVLFDFVGVLRGWPEKGFFCLILLLYLTWASVPFSYIISHFIETKTNGYTHFLVIHFCIGILPAVYTYQILRFQDFEGLKLIAYTFSLFPPFSLTSALVHFFHAAAERNFCFQKNSDWGSLCKRYNAIIEESSKKDRFSYSNVEDMMDNNKYFRSCCKSYCKKRGICHEPASFVEKSTSTLLVLQYDLVALAAQGIFYWILLIGVEKRVIQESLSWLCSRVIGNKERRAAQDDVRDLDEPEEVKKEHLKVDYMIDIEGTVESDVFLVQNVTKFFKVEKCIDHAYFTTPVNESTAILGLSKSGLTTLVKLLTTELTPSGGHIYMDNELVQVSNRLQFTMKMGYCPQRDAFFPQLTAAQNLYVMGRLRGVETTDIDVHVHHYLDIFDLRDYASTAAKTFRPGVRRRLACALAMIGQPRVLILDQPTLRMDASEQHTFWKCITKAKAIGETVIYTSSNTEEVLASANKVILLDIGSIIAIGNTQDVVQTSKRGYILTVRCKSQTLKGLDAYEGRVLVDQLRDHIVKYLSPCELLLDDEYILIYSLMDPTAKLSYNYGIMEGARETFPTLVDNFLVAEPSLDEVVLNFHQSSQRRTSQRLSVAPADDSYGLK